MTIKVLLVDDQILFVEMLRTVLLSRADDFDVVGIAGSGQEALDAVRENEPDVVLLDVKLPGLDGVRTVPLILDIRPETRIVMLTTFDDDNYVQEAVAHGAVGYLLKDIKPEMLFTAIRVAHSGGSLVSPQVFKRLAGGDRETDPNLAHLDEVIRMSIATFSGREREILALIGQGLTNQEIADRLSLAVQTVKNYVSAIYLAFDVHDRSKVCTIARRYRIVPNSTSWGPE